MVSSTPDKLTKQFTPLMNYLQSKGISVGKVIVAKDVKQMINYFESEEVHFAFESPYGALKLMDSAGAIPALIREKKGVKRYNSVIFVRKDSPIKLFSDLKGKRIAFEDKDSTSSFFLPRVLLEKNGLRLIKSEKVVSGRVAYYFTGDDRITIAQVHAGKRADAGGIKKTAIDKNPNFRILRPESKYVPRHVLSINKSVSSSLRKKLVDVILNMKNDPAAKSVLKTIKTPTGFSEFSEDPLLIMNRDVRSALIDYDYIKN